jgi:hypothetical protein
MSSHFFTHVDTDGLDAIYRAHGVTRPPGRDEFFHSAIGASSEFFQRNGIRATYFVIAEDLDDPEKRAALRAVADAGHGIASHGYHHRLVDRIPMDLKRKEIFDAKLRIEDVLGQPVSGYRAPGCQIDREALLMLAEAGFTYDSSIFPSPERCQALGIESGGAEPFEAVPGLTEAPMPWVGRNLPPFHPCYTFYLRVPYFRWCLDRFAARSRVMTLLFHFSDFAERQGDLPSARLRIFTNDFFNQETKLRFCQRMLDAVRERFEPDTCEARWATH